MTLEFELTQIFIRGSSLSERLRSKAFQNSTYQSDEDLTSDSQFLDAQMAHWCQLIAQDDRATFHKRLSWDGLDEETARAMLSAPPKRAEGSPLPSWVETLGEIIQTSKDFCHKSKRIDLGKLPIYPEIPLPFEDLLLPTILVARQKLLTKFNCDSLSSDCSLLKLVSLKAYLDLERGLLQQLVDLSIKTFQEEFSHSRPIGYSLLSSIVNKQVSTKSTTHYDAFVEQLLADGLLNLFQKYPVLGRLIATAIEFWVEATTEFLQRLEADYPDIQRLFSGESSHQATDESKPLVDPSPLNSTAKLGKVIAIEPHLSDLHNRGRSVMILKFESKLKVVYKPKNLGLEVVYNQFLDYYNRHQSSSLTLKTLTVHDCHHYGWLEYVEHLPIQDESAAQRFYQRVGMLICVLYILRGTDCHHENLIASGEHPVLIDMETLVYHEARTAEAEYLSEVTDKQAYQQMYNSVLTCGLLPEWRFDKDERRAYDISGLGDIRPLLFYEAALQWKFINTDDMQLGWERPVHLPVGKNQVVLGGATLYSHNYIEEIREGFKQMYRFFSEQRQTLLGVDGVLTNLKKQRVRFVLRATKVYGVILSASLAPQFLKHGITRSIELDVLTRAFTFGQQKPQEWSILRSEIESMEQLDIPYFGSTSDSDALIFGVEQPIEKFFKRPSYDQVQDRLHKLNDVDLIRQLALIKNAFYASAAQTFSLKTDKIVPGHNADSGNVLPATSKQLLDSAQKLAGLIEKSAIQEEDGSVNWIGLGLVGKSMRFKLQILNQSLYDGNCGIALFLAALDRVCGGNEFRNLALGAIQPLREFYQTIDGNEPQNYLVSNPISMSSGIAGQVYSLVKISQFLQESAILKDALQASNLITSQAIAEDRQLDIMAGAAGAILSLLALYQETENLAVLDKAILCGQHLLKNRSSFDGSPRAWKTMGEIPLTGFSHGAAGIAHALLQLYAVTQDCAYREAAIEGMTYEQSVFNPSAANWPDFRAFARQANGNPGFMASWCHGAPGIGLARLGSLNILDTAEIRQEIEVALQTTQKNSLNEIDNLCCGDFGRIEFLLMAAQTLGREEVSEFARLRASKLIARAEKRGGYQMFNNLPPTVFSPGFFLGASGIGYELLRLAYPDKLPSVLLGN